jgi:hypothetical protein
MRSSFFLAAASASLAFADYIRCGAPNVSEVHKAQMDAAVAAAQDSFSAQAANVDVYVHVVTTSSKQGRYSQTQINNQIAAMVSSLEPTPISTSV